MTRKDYVLIAEALKEARAQCAALGLPSRGYVTGAERAAYALADALLRDNPHHFDRARFLRAAGVQS